MEKRSATAEEAQQAAESELALLKEKSEGTIADLRKRLEDHVTVSGLWLSGSNQRVDHLQSNINLA